LRRCPFPALIGHKKLVSIGDLFAEKGAEIGSGHFLGKFFVVEICGIILGVVYGWKA
jgi:hypothetical protein